MKPLTCLYIHVTKQITIETCKIKDVIKLLPHFASDTFFLRFFYDRCHICIVVSDTFFLKKKTPLWKINDVFFTSVTDDQVAILR
jgi:hypothetical protein